MQEIDSILDRLKDLSETDYKIFNNKIIPTKHQMLGVRTPILRKIAKQIVKENALEFIELDKQNIYEMILLEGIVLSYMNKPFNLITPLIENYLNKVDNWAQIDSTVCNFKNVKKEDFVTIKKWLKSEKEFFVRAGLIMLLAHYIKKENLQMIFDLSQKITHSGYYVHMGNAWLISVCMARFPTQTISFFKNNTLDKKTHNKAIVKSCESYRVSKENKALIKQLRK